MARNALGMTILVLASMVAMPLLVRPILGAGSAQSAEPLRAQPTAVRGKARELSYCADPRRGPVRCWQDRE
jgi:hypothetical protein